MTENMELSHWAPEVNEVAVTSPFIYFKVFAITVLTSAPLLTFVGQGLSSSNLEACTEACVFIRYAGTPGLPATTFQNLGISRDVETGFCQFPLFVSVRNGQALQVKPAPDLSLKGVLASPSRIFFYPPLLYSCTANWLSNSSRQAFPNASKVTAEHCERQSTAKRIRNHLADGLTRWVYLTGIIMWTSLKVVHDWALLCGTPEWLSLSLGIGSWVFQAVACFAAFVWSTAAVEVFAEESGCYYQLALWETVFFLATPLVLLLATMSKFEQIRLSNVHGDYLHAITYDVPFRVVKATLPWDPTQNLLTVGLRGDPDMTPCSYQKLAWVDAAFFETQLWWIGNLWRSAIAMGIGPFAAGPLFRRLVGTVQTGQWAFGVSVALRLLIAAALCSGIAMSLHMAIFQTWFFGRRVRASLLSTTDRSRSMFTCVLHVFKVLIWCYLLLFCAVGFVSAIGFLLQNESGHGGDALNASWTWYACGTNWWFLAWFCLTHSVNAACRLNVPQMRLYLFRPGRMPLQQMKDFSDNHPEFQLQEHLAFYDTLEQQENGGDRDQFLRQLRTQIDWSQSRFHAKDATELFIQARQDTAESSVDGQPDSTKQPWSLLRIAADSCSDTDPCSSDSDRSESRCFLQPGP